MNFGEYLKAIRKNALMTQRELAAKVGVGFPYISKLENNVEPPPSDEVLLKLAKELNVDVNEMFIKANKIPLALEKYLIQTPEAIRLLRLIKREDAASFLLKHFNVLVPNRENRKTGSVEETEKVVLLIDPETSAILYANKAAIEFYRYDEKDFRKLKITDINTLPKNQVVDEMNKAQMELRNHFRFKHRLKDNTIKDVKVYSKPVAINGKIYLNSVIYGTDPDRTIIQ